MIVYKNSKNRKRKNNIQCIVIQQGNIFTETMNAKNNMNSSIRIHRKTLIGSLLSSILLASLYCQYCYSHSSIPCEVPGLLAGVIGAFCLCYVVFEKRLLFSMLFSSSWMLGLHFSLYKLSGLQYVYPSYYSWYFLVIGISPLIIEIFCFHSSIKYDFKRMNVSKGVMISISYTLAFISAILFAYISITAGSYLTEGERVVLEAGGAESFLQVVCSVFTRVSFYLASFLVVEKASKAGIVVVGYGMLYALLSMSRSLLIHFIIYIVLLLMIENKISVRKICFAAIASIVLFGVLGNIRQGDAFSINEYSSIEGLDIFSWLYSYICPNFDNLALQMEYGTPSWSLSYVLSPIISVFDLKFDWYQQSYIYIGHLNLGTFFRDYVCDLGNYALIPFLLTIVILLCILRKKSNIGIMSCVKMAILSEIVLAPLTNHFTSSTFWLSVLILGFVQLVDGFWKMRAKGRESKQEKASFSGLSSFS